MPQLREARDRWYGHAVAETITVFEPRFVHPEEAALYLFQADVAFDAVLPYQVTNECTGLFVRIVNDNQGGGGSTITVRDGALNSVGTVAPGESAMVILTDTVVRTGSWLVLTSAEAFQGRLPL